MSDTKKEVTQLLRQRAQDLATTRADEPEDWLDLASTLEQCTSALRLAARAENGLVSMATLQSGLKRCVAFVAAILLACSATAAPIVVDSWQANTGYWNSWQSSPPLFIAQPVQYWFDVDLVATDALEVDRLALTDAVDGDVLYEVAPGWYPLDQVDQYRREALLPGAAADGRVFPVQFSLHDVRFERDEDVQYTVSLTSGLLADPLTHPNGSLYRIPARVTFAAPEPSTALLAAVCFLVWCLVRKGGAR